MADALDIEGDVRYDGDRPYKNDPFFVDLTIRDGGGQTITADVRVSLYDEDQNELQTTTKEVQGEGTLYVQSPEMGIVTVWARAVSGSMDGTTEIGVVYVGEAPDLPDPATTAPTINSFFASNPQSQDLRVEFETDTQLGTSAGDIAVAVTDSQDNSVVSLGRTDFSESGAGPYTYVTTYALPSDGTYTAELVAAKDPAGNDGANGDPRAIAISCAASIGLGTVLSWKTRAATVDCS